MLNTFSFKVTEDRPTRVYLAAPYSHTNKLWMQIRFELVNLAAMALIDLGYVVFSPISHSHPIATSQEAAAAKQDYQLWLGQDKHFMEWADILVVFTLPGWATSYGVDYESKWFEEHKKPIEFLTIDDVYYHKPRRSNGHDQSNYHA